MFSWRNKITARAQLFKTNNIIQYGSGKRTNFFFHFADQFYSPRFSTEWFGINHSEWKSFTQSYRLNIPRTFSGPQCTHYSLSVCEYLRVAIDYSVQVSLTTQIILSHDDNQTKIVTTANTINTLLTGAGSSRIRLQNVRTYINSSASDNQLYDWFFFVSASSIKGYIRTTAGSPNAQGRQRIWPKASDDF